MAQNCPALLVFPPPLSTFSFDFSLNSPLAPMFLSSPSASPSPHVAFLPVDLPTVLHLPPELQPQPASHMSPPGSFSGHLLSLNLRIPSFSVPSLAESSNVHPFTPSCASSLFVVDSIFPKDGHNDISYATRLSYNVTLTLVLLRDESILLPFIIGWIFMTVLMKEYGQNDIMWLLRLDHKRPYSFYLVYMNTCS